MIYKQSLFFAIALVISVVSFANPAPVVSVASIEASGVVLNDSWWWGGALLEPQDLEGLFAKYWQAASPDSFHLTN